MAVSTVNIISTLNDLIETCKDGERGFRQAADAVKDSNMQTLFREYARQRSEFASRLQRQVSRLGHELEQPGSVTAAVHRGWMGLKAALSGGGEAILDECERGEDSAVEAYRGALEKNLPSGIQAIVQRQYEQVQRAHTRVRELRDRGEVKTLKGYGD